MSEAMTDEQIDLIYDENKQPLDDIGAGILMESLWVSRRKLQEEVRRLRKENKSLRCLLELVKQVNEAYQALKALHELEKADLIGGKDVLMKPDYPFRSDGCTMFPDGHWRRCCIEHDKDYWMGGTLAERKKSDEQLRYCVREMCLSYDWKPWAAWAMSRFMYFGVRVFGRLPIRHARWGFGWKYPRTGP